MYLAAGEGVLSVHQAELVHRDFKPDNVLIGKDERPLVADFGLAQLTGDAVPLEKLVADEERLAEHIRTNVAPTPVLVASAYPASATATASLSMQPSVAPAPMTTWASPLKRSVFSKSAATAGSRQFRSGCSGANRCRYQRPSGVRYQAGPPNSDRQLFGGCSDGGAKW